MITVGMVLLFEGYIGKARVLAVHPAGTIDVQMVSDGKCFRVSGLSFTH